MITRKDDYKIDEVSYLLDLPSRTVLALCDAGILNCSRVIANGALKQRKKRHIAHAEILRFNLSRPPEKRADLASRLADADSEQIILPIMAADAARPPDDNSVWLTPVEWRAVVAAITKLALKFPALKSVADRIGPAGCEVAAKGLRVNPMEAAS